MFSMQDSDDLEGKVQEQNSLGVLPTRGRYSTISDLFRETMPGIKRECKQYLVDVAATWAFYLPTMAGIEFISGMDSEEVVRSRLTSAATAIVIARPFTKLRSSWAGYLDANSGSSPSKKFLVDTSITLITQPPTYAAILYLSGASLKEAAVAIPTGLLFGAASARLFGKFLDSWRSYFGVEATL
ncbi:L-alanine exporter AlaE [Candidatus Woesearchaeota archaeon]|nr:L-alanine exporter AlaE [Candidatus Woesearchaeota archaeon]